MRMKIPWYLVGTVLVSMTLLAGCFGDGGSPYPSLNNAQLVGCWFMPSPYPGSACVEGCYSESGRFYSKTAYHPIPSIPNPFTEASGVYSLGGGTDIAISIAKKSNFDSDIDSSKYNPHLTIINDTLNDIASDGTLYPYIRSDSDHNCGAHWLLFPMPSDWELP